jgi:hypothetical protein
MLLVRVIGIRMLETRNRAIVSLVVATEMVSESDKLLSISNDLYKC